MFKYSSGQIFLTLNIAQKNGIRSFLDKRFYTVVFILLVVVSVISFIYFHFNGLSLAYNDARSHLDISRRVVEGLKPGLAQLGSVWLPLLHIMMIPTIGNDFMWHSGLSGAIVSMVSFVITGLLIGKFLKKLGVGTFGQLTGVLIFVSNLNILYLQSTAMTELLLMATMTAGIYELLIWYTTGSILRLVRSSFWIMLSTLVRYDGWFLLIYAFVLILLRIVVKHRLKLPTIEGTVVLFFTLGGFGIALWFLWNLIIFKDPLYFVFGPYSAYSQQILLEGAGNLATKGNLLLSVQYYIFALVYNTGALTALLALLASIIFWLDKRVSLSAKIAVSALLVPLFFNILALYLGHSVLYVKGLSGNTWFNIRYGAMMVPSIAIFVGFLVDRSKQTRSVIIGLLVLVTFVSGLNRDAVTIDDAVVGASQKDVTQIAGWLNENASSKDGFVLVSAASHDAIIFSSGLPMKKFIHEGTGQYWEMAIKNPQHYARWLIYRTNDLSDFGYQKLIGNPQLASYNLIGNYPFADLYELKPEYLNELQTDEIFAGQK